MPRLDDDILGVVHGARGVRAQLQRLIAKVIAPHRLAQLLFYGEDGQLKPEAVDWFGQLAAENFVDRSTFHDDPRVHAFREGQRALAIKILGSVRLDTAKLARLHDQLKEAGYD